MRKGFTVVELVIVIAIIAILTVVVFVVIDPFTRFQDSHDSTRLSHATALLDAAKVDQVNNEGAYLSSIEKLTDDAYYEIGTCAPATASCTAQATAVDCVDLTELATRGYIDSVPTDPHDGNAVNTGYYLSKRADGSVQIGACDVENTPGGIQVER